MIIRLLLAGFVSIVFSFCYLAGLVRLVSALLIGFGVLTAVSFAIVFLLPPDADRLLFPISVSGASWPFFVIALFLILLIVWLFLHKTDPAEEENLSARHMKFFGGGLLLYITSLFIPIAFWFPSDEKRLMLGINSQGTMVFIGVCLYLAASSAALLLLYRASRGTTLDHPDLMRRFVPALFAFFHLDKMPALVAYLLIYSEEAQFVFPKIAALALVGYIPVGIFLAKLCFDSRSAS